MVQIYTWRIIGLPLSPVVFHGRAQGGEGYSVLFFEVMLTWLSAPPELKVAVTAFLQWSLVNCRHTSQHAMTKLLLLQNLIWFDWKGESLTRHSDSWNAIPGLSLDFVFDWIWQLGLISPHFDSWKQQNITLILHK